MTTPLTFNCMTTAIGSVPFTDAAASARFVLDSGIDVPFWPQLPKRDFRELMNPQFAEGLPCFRTDRATKRTWFEVGDDKPEQMTHFYEKLLAGDHETLGLSEDVAAGYHAFLDELRSRALHFDWLKGQVTGPITLTLSMQDQDRRPIYYDPELQEAAVQALIVKGTQQVEALGRFAERVLIFIDEPVLAAFGTSAYLSLKEEDVIRLIDALAGPLREAGAVVGVHCCGNTDWAKMTQTKTDVLSFDAYGYGDSVCLYPAEVGRFLDRGSALAWGIVPTSEEVRTETAETLAARLDEQMQHLASRGIDMDRLEAQALITPSCGTGPMEEADALKAFGTLVDLGRKLRDR